MSAVTNSVCALAGKFRGCLVGSLLGDCLGAPFEGDFPVSKSVLTSYVSKLLEESSKGLLPFRPYTDDTAMTRSVGQSLIDNKGFHASDLARRFTTEYYDQPKRGYGMNVVDVFHALKKNNFEDPYGPAKDQFQGKGSYGNGGAMRVAPVALFCYNNDEKLIDLAEKQAQITHSHRNGYNGAILQCLAVYQAARSDSNIPLNKAAYLDYLLEKMDAIESKGVTVLNPAEDKPYTQSLKNMKRFLCDDPQDLSAEEVAALFGNDVSAAKSVPTAVYTFLRSQEPLSFFETESPFVRAVVLSIAVGGDTDTIASMAGSISGAFHGIAGIPTRLQRHCEGLDNAIKMADEIYELVGAH
ncbi:ADP-ribosylhydrolase ARH3-like [Ornithodoros turicata]|uniref:ADP-ribosylhydrolase ARH3 n=1 Tax=Ornithodoros turicata TaxID=34597 RepID=A0A2R5LGY9_9ACAR